MRRGREDTGGRGGWVREGGEVGESWVRGDGRGQNEMRLFVFKSKQLVGDRLVSLKHRHKTPDMQTTFVSLSHTHTHQRHSFQRGDDAQLIDAEEAVKQHKAEGGGGMKRSGRGLRTTC